MTTPQPSTIKGTDLVLVTDGPRFGYDYQGFEEVRGLARYSDGTFLLVTHRVSYSDSTPAAPVSAAMAYRTLLDNPEGPWRVIDFLPDAARDFITAQSAGASGTVSGRDIEVLAYDDGLIGRTIDIERGVDLDHWVTY